MAATTKTAPIAPELQSEAARHGKGDASAGLDRREEADLFALLAVPGRLGTQQRAELYRIYAEAFDRAVRRDTLVDAASEMSFPASDPPSYMGGASVAGAPDQSTPTEKVNTRVSDPEAVKPTKDDGTPEGGEPTRSKG